MPETIITFINFPVPVPISGQAGANFAECYSPNNVIAGIHDLVVVVVAGRRAIGRLLDVDRTACGTPADASLNDTSV